MFIQMRTVMDWGDDITNRYNLRDSAHREKLMEILDNHNPQPGVQVQYIEFHIIERINEDRLRELCADLPVGNPSRIHSGNAGSYNITK